MVKVRPRERNGVEKVQLLTTDRQLVRLELVASEEGQLGREARTHSVTGPPTNQP
jgi:hypothetical protein